MRKCMDVIGMDNALTINQILSLEKQWKTVILI